MKNQSKIRNIAIIAHVDHGKTTLVDELFKQSDTFKSHQTLEERAMDSIDLEKERGITIKAKNGSCQYGDYFINIIDTPGHADFGGEVERVLKMADGAVFLVDAAEGPMPQSYFVLRKAVGMNLPIIVVVNKIDKPAARPAWAVDQVFDLLVQLNAPDHILDFPVLYAAAREGYAKNSLEEQSSTLQPLFEKIVQYIPAPKGDSNGNLQILVSSLIYSSFMGRLAVGKITSGNIKVNQDVVVADEKGNSGPLRVTKIYEFEQMKHIEIESAGVGEIVAIAGLKDVQVGQTVTSVSNPVALPAIPIDPPTIAIKFLPNDSPFNGKEGEFVTSRQLRERLYHETLSDIAMKVEDDTQSIGYKVSGRGELHLSIFIEKLRREGYEFQVSRPTVIFKEEGGKKLEPYEMVTIDVPSEFIGKVIEALNSRKGMMQNLEEMDHMTRIIYKVPTRGLLGYQSDFMMDTKGMGVINYTFAEYGPHVGELKSRKNGVLICMETGKSTAYALFNLEDRGVMIIGDGVDVYEGQIVGQHNRDNDLVVNICKGKKLTNMRASGTDDNIQLTPHWKMSLEQCLSFINDDELVEFTPKTIRLRKLYLKEVDRKKYSKS
jgi:GTP-binding protein